MKKMADSFYEWADKVEREAQERMTLLKIIDTIIRNLSNEHLKLVLSYLNTIDRLSKMELIAELESGELTESGKQELEKLKREVGEIKET